MGKRNKRVGMSAYGMSRHEPLESTAKEKKIIAI
jgi:hypothetical protein